VPRPIDLLAEFALDAWLIARFSPRIAGTALDGRMWESMVAGLLHRPGFTRHQGPGTLNLFGSRALAGARHEIDAAADSWRGLFMVECKATMGGITKSDAAIFHYKIMDYYQHRITLAAQEEWWGFLCGTEQTPASARASAVNLGLLVCDPARLPLPVLFRAASRPAADMHLPEALLQEIVRLGERALCCHQERWRFRPHSREITFNPHRWRDAEIEDLLWLEDELSDCVLDLFERRRPGFLEIRATALLWRARKVA
jgi:hypothetical protein